MNYEANMKELEEIVKKLTDEKLGVSEGLTLYEKGIAMAKQCLNDLNEIKGKMEILNKELEELEIIAEEEEDD